MKIEKKLILILISFFLLARIYQLALRVNFSADQGMTLLKVYEIWQEKKIPWVGPESSIKSIHQESFYHGPWIYYFLLPIVVITNWNPLAGSFLFILLNLLALIFLFLGTKEKFGLKTAFITSLFFVLNLTMINFSIFFWNPNFLPFCTCLLIYLWFKVFKTKNFIYFFPLGLIIGFGLTNHYLFFLAIIPFLIWLIKRRASLKELFLFMEGLIIPFIPFVIFEIQHSFINLQTIASIFRYGSNEKLSFPLPTHYYLSLFPYLFLIIALVIKKVWQKNKFLGQGLVLFFIIYSLFKILAKPLSGYTMPLGWNYLGIKKAGQKILNENKEKYNIANLLYGDTRAYALRSIVTTKGLPPLKENEYPISQYLFVLSDKSKEEIINLPTWEISSFCPCDLKESWFIQNDINLYLLQKND